MSSTKSHQVINSYYPYINRQLILGRDDRPFGSETKIIKGAQGLSLNGESALPSKKQACLYSEMLMHSQLTAFTLRTENKSKTCTLSHLFVCIELSSLCDPTLIEELFHSGEVLRNYGLTLVVVVSAIDAHATCIRTQRNIIQYIYHLKDHNIEIALEARNPQLEFPDIFTMLDLFNYVKIEISELASSSTNELNLDAFNQLYDWMSVQKSRTSVAFIAQNVSFSPDHLFAKALPFDYFQGDYYSPADRI